MNLSCQIANGEMRGSKIGCVLALDFKHKDGDSFMDRSVYGHLCTNYGSKWQLDGRYFDGVDDLVSIPDAPSLKFGTGDFTSEVSVKTTQMAPSGAYPIYLAKDDEKATRSGWTIYQAGSNNRVVFAIISGGTEATAASTFTANDGKQHRLVGLKQRTKIDLFADTQIIATANHSLGSTDKAVPVEIGNKAGVANRQFKGLVSTAQVHNFADYAPRILSRSIGG